MVAFGGDLVFLKEKKRKRGFESNFRFKIISPHLHVSMSSVKTYDYVRFKSLYVTSVTT